MKNVFLLILLSSITSCSSHYSSLEDSGRSYGYSEMQIETDIYSLFYQGSGTNTLEEVEKYWFLRASELCNKEFEIIEKYQAPLHGKVSIFINGIRTNIKTKRPRINGRIKCSK